MIRKNEILVKQKRISPGLLVFSIVSMMTVLWMTLDMYLPALPVLKTEFGVSEALLNVSVNSGLFLCAAGTLIGGTVSDKYGRKPVILFGLFLSILSLFISGFSKGVTLLIVMRGITGLGEGFALSVATAMIRDSFRGETFRTVTTITQAAAVIGPVFAPAIGALLIEFLSWRWIFFVLGLAIAVSSVPFLIATETWPEEKRCVKSVIQATLQSFQLAKNGSFLSIMCLMMVITVPMWAFLSVCSYVFFDDFNVSSLTYSILYAADALFSFIAPFLYMWMSRKMKGKYVLDTILLLLAAAAVLMLLIGSSGPVFFAAAAVPILMTEAMIRPMSMVIVLDEYPNEAGSVSALTGFAQSIVSLPATAVATLQWGSFITGLTVICTACFIIALFIWIVMVKKKVYANHFGIS